MRVTRRGIQIALALLWILDGALQLQPYMFTHGFAHDIIAPTGSGQPAFVASGVHWAATVIAAHPVLWDALFAAGQLALGIGILIRPTVRAALAASVLWSFAVWYLGEGLGGLASAHADLLTGAPGAVLLYAVLAVAVWPRRDANSPGHREAILGSGAPPAAWLPVAWAVLWVGSAVLRALPGQNTATALAGEVSGNADGAPGWLASLDHNVATTLHGSGSVAILVLITIEAIIGLAALVPGRARAAAAIAGIVVSVAFWVVGQSVGELYTGQATDPNAAPLVVLVAFGLLGRLHWRMPRHDAAAAQQSA